eukprot:CAMPEP_0194587374 /NCGR_PEP_ID=MMETSP0292-20121207/19108_1 /TAXON_ID=39354 /ORGANISM="Heterosigma akashiwo, Strain CCMP2393" /LENGTH=458 /DNA_ID=CAMNT_0039443597 /DNA_START=183 /DNA_END=1560 /DNA_ORIENTATION=-
MGAICGSRGGGGLFCFFYCCLSLWHHHAAADLGLNPKIELIGDAKVRLEACSSKKWEDPGVEIKNIPQGKEENVKIFQQWKDGVEVDLSQPGVYQATYKACSDNNEKCSQILTREVEVKKSIGPKIDLGSDFHIQWFNQARDLEVSASDPCVKGKLPLCTKCAPQDDLCQMSCVSFKAVPIKFEDFDGVKALARAGGPSLSEKKTFLDRATYYCDAGPSHSYGGGGNGEPSLGADVLDAIQRQAHEKAADQANAAQDLSLLANACGVYDVVFTAADYAGNLGWRHAELATTVVPDPRAAWGEGGAPGAAWAPKRPRYFERVGELRQYAWAVGGGFGVVVALLASGAVAFRSGGGSSSGGAEEGWGSSSGGGAAARGAAGLAAGAATAAATAMGRRGGGASAAAAVAAAVAAAGAGAAAARAGAVRRGGKCSLGRAAVGLLLRAQILLSFHGRRKRSIY